MEDARIVDVPVPQIVEELVEVFKVSPQDRIVRRSVEQTIETLAFSLAEKIVEMLVTQTQGFDHRIDQPSARRGFVGGHRKGGFQSRHCKALV